jgi:hypothetical protein
LSYFYPRMLPGGYIIVHDYASLAWSGAEKAVDEFFADKPEAIIPLTDGGGSVVIRKSRGESGRDNWLMRRRCAFFSSEWSNASQGGLADILTSGWSGVEPWGVWGVGPSHIIDLYMDTAPQQDVQIGMEVAAALLGSRTMQDIDVFAGGRLLTTWNFSGENNRAERTLTVPATAVISGDWKFPVIRLEFRPRSVATIAELDPAMRDDRAVGIALFKLRRLR